MKRLLLLIVALCTGFTGFAQELKPVSKDVRDIAVTRQYQVPTDLTPPMLNKYEIPSGDFKSATMLGTETEIIETVYDLQTNADLSNRIWVWEDGTIAAVATRGIENPSGFAFPDRGTGYNYYDGSAWGPKPSQRLESIRTGWPSIAGWGENGEVVVSHDFGSIEIMVLTRENKGTGAWEEKMLEGPDGGPGIVWPRMTTSGDNNEYIHVFALTLPSANGGSPWMGQDGALLYYRSADGGETWDIRDEQLEGIGEDFYLNLSADDYILSSKGSTVVLVTGSPWYDMAMWKSTDNGDTWEKTVIWEHPYPFFDLQTDLMSDTLWAVDGSVDAAIDDNGNVHVVWGVGRVSRLEAAPPDPGFYSYWPYTDGVGYWNETMEAPIPEAENPHHTLMDTYLEEMGMLVGWSQDVNGSGVRLDFEGTGDPQFNTYRELGVSGMPSIAIYDSWVFVVYSSVTETFMTADGAQNYKHIWNRSSYDLGQNWGEFYDVVADNIFHLYDECIYPVLAEQVDPSVSFQLIYQADNIPGLYLDEDHDPVTNRIIHNNMIFTVGVNEPGDGMSNVVEVSHCYPNPTNGVTQITVDLSRDHMVGVEFFNMTGQKVFEIPATSLQAGSHILSFDASSFTPGVYFYKITAGAESVSRKMIVE